MIASLPMYARPQLRDAHDAFWAAIRDRLRARGLAAPEALDHDIGLWEAWPNPDLCLSQTCNLPYRAHLHDRVTLIAAADYGLPGASAGHYYSQFVVRAEDAGRTVTDFATKRFAFNEAGSHSGWAAPQIWAKAQGFQFDASLQTGAHVASAHAVANRAADIAALDAVTFRNLRRFDPIADKLAVIGRTYESPGLSFITRAGQDPAPYRDAITQALETLAPRHREALGLTGIVAIPAQVYLDLPTPAAPAEPPRVRTH